MYIYYEIGIVVGLIFVVLAIHILRKTRITSYPFNIINLSFSMAISLSGILIIVASLAAIQPQNWYTSSLLWKILIAS